MLMEFAPKGDFKKYLEFRGRIEEREALHYVFQLLHAVASLHANDIIHRDIKLENMLLNEHAEVKLCDFGWVSPPEDNERNVLCGTYEYMAPEVVQQHPYDHKIDVWSIGILAYELVHGSTPFVSTSPQEIADKILNGTYNLRGNLSYEYRDFISACLSANPVNRPTSQKLLSHPAFIPILHHYYKRTSIDTLKKDSRIPESFSSITNYSARDIQETCREMPSRFSHLNADCLVETERIDQAAAGVAEYSSTPRHEISKQLPAELQLLSEYNRDQCDIEPAEPPGGVTFQNIEDYVEFDVGLGGVIDYLKDKGEAFFKLFSHSPEQRKTMHSSYKSPLEIKRLLKERENEDSYHYSPGFTSPVKRGQVFRVRANLHGQQLASKFSKPVPDTPDMDGVSPDGQLRCMQSPSFHLTSKLKGIFGQQASPKYQMSTDSQPRLM